MRLLKGVLVSKSKDKDAQTFPVLQPRKWQGKSLGPSSNGIISEMQRRTRFHPILKHARTGCPACMKGAVEWEVRCPAVLHQVDHWARVVARHHS